MEGPFGFYEAVDYTPARLPRGQTSAIVRSFMAHHQGMNLVALSHALLGRPMQKRFEADPSFQATLMLLQERIPKTSAFHTHVAQHAEGSAFSNPPDTSTHAPIGADTPTPEVQLLSNGRLHVMVTNAGGGYCRWKDLAITRWREDTTCDNWGSFVYLRDVDSGEYWSATHQPTLRRADSYEAMFTEGRAEYRRRDLDYETYTEIVVSPEDDIELRRLRITNHSDSAADDRSHELRRGGAGAAGRGRVAAVVRQPVRADGNRPGPAHDPVHAAAAIGHRADALDVPPDRAARRSWSARRRTRRTGPASSGAAARSRRPSR